MQKHIYGWGFCLPLGCRSYTLAFKENDVDLLLEKMEFFRKEVEKIFLHLTKKTLCSLTRNR